jgi:energy-coupling factor transport system permease protein
MTAGTVTIDPRTKIVIVLCISTIGIFTKNILILSLMLALSAIICIVLKAKIKRILKKLIWLFFMLAVVQSVFAPSGRVLFGIGGIELLTVGGLTKGIEILLRMLIIIISAGIVTTSKPEDVIQGFIEWKLPYEIVFMISIAIRFLPMLTQEFKDAITAIQLRGVELKQIPIKMKISIYTYIFTPVVVNSIVKSRDLSVAMEMRAFRAYPQRTSYMKLKLNAYDYAIILISLVATVNLLIFSAKI